MSARIIVSYDGTANDDDALALGRMLAQTGAQLALAYVRHARELDSKREQLGQHDAERRLQFGAAGLGDADVARHIVVSPSTGEGLAELATDEGASVIVFGSDYRTAPGHVEPGGTAQYLLEGGPIAIAVAPAGLRTSRDAAIRTVAVSSSGGDLAAQQTAEAIADKLRAELVAAGQRSDLIIVSSQVGAPAGRISLSGAARNELNSARSAVLVLPVGAPVLLL